jgi:surface protein
MAISDYLKQLQEDKESLIVNLKSKNINTDNKETFTTLVPKVSNVSGDGDTKYIPEYISFYNYLGSNINATLRQLDTRKLTSMQYMFAYSKLTSIDLSLLNTENVTDMRYMFQGVSTLTEIDLSKLNTPNVTNMYGLLLDCSNLTSVNIDGLNVSNVTNMGSFFNGCNKITELDLSNLDMGNVTSLYMLCDECYRLKSFKLGRVSDKLTRTERMFFNANSIEYVDISTIDFRNITNSSLMFAEQDDCEIIVKDDYAKEWFATKYPKYKYVKTLAEKEAE